MSLNATDRRLPALESGKNNEQQRSAQSPRHFADPLAALLHRRDPAAHQSEPDYRTPGGIKLLEQKRIQDFPDNLEARKWLENDGSR